MGAFPSESLELFDKTDANSLMASFFCDGSFVGVVWLKNMWTFVGLWYQPFVFLFFCVFNVSWSSIFCCADEVR